MTVNYQKLYQEMRDERDELAEKLRQLTDQMFGGDTSRIPPELHLTGKESAMLSCLMRGGIATKEKLLNYLYQGMDEPDIKIIDVFVCKLRKKIALHGIIVETVWGRGYMLSSAGKQKVEEMWREQVARWGGVPDEHQAA